MKAEDLMTNDSSDQFRIFVYAKVNVVNCWSCRTLDDAVKSIELFFAQTKKFRSRAVIKNRECNAIIREIENT